MINCDHYSSDKGFQLESKQNQGQSPIFTCKICRETFTQEQAYNIIEGLL